ncbi:MAG: transketolase [Gammaproteobacteria bacterium]|nr:transketolase [Gammaproteobacteria bacterium]
MPSRRELANAIRVLSMDAVEQANSGHPGMPMGMADIAEVLWNDHLQHNPQNPDWFNRDRFVLSNGHGSMLLYSVLHLSGYALSIDDLKDFRQLGSKTPGHPEYREAPGVETTTGPLGQGIANAVGMALAERILAARFNRPGHDVVDHRTYAFTGDGCLMEGISHEVCSLAGTLGLGKLTVLYDDNGISIDGEVSAWFSDDTARRFESYGWQVVTGVDGHDADAVNQALKEAKSDATRPTLICCRTTIGFGSPAKAGKESSHGAPLGADEIEKTRAQLGWSHPPFVIPNDVYSNWNAVEAGQRAEAEWNGVMAGYAQAHPDLATEFNRTMNGELAEGWADKAQAFIDEMAESAQTVASRKASQLAIEGLAPLAPELVGGSADLTGSNLTNWSGTKAVAPTDYDGNYVYYGVREFGMSAIMNGLALHGGLIPYGGTFLTFSDYSRNALRMAALMGIQGVFVFTHDSIGLGEDGPTHQSVEHANALRIIPNMSVWRPCDTVETAVAWRYAIERRNGPTSLLLSRQNLAHQSRSAQQIADVAKGGYVLRDVESPQAIVMATGSEVALASDAAAALAEEGIAVRVVSMPSTDLFDQQSDAYRNSVLPSDQRCRVAIEAGVSDFWRKYVGLDGAVIGVDDFGLSAPAGEVFKKFGFTVDNVVATVRSTIKSMN